MRIVCPACTATYDVPDSLLVPGRIVRCAKCGGEWIALTVEAPAVEEPEPEAAAWEEAPPQPPRLTAMERLSRSPAVLPRDTILLRAAWAGSIAALLLLVWGAFAWRSDVMRSWPPSARLYTALGLTVR